MGIGRVCADSEQRRPSQVLHPAAPNAAPRLVRRDGPEARGPACSAPTPAAALFAAYTRTRVCAPACGQRHSSVLAAGVSSGRRLQRRTNLALRRRAWCSHQQQQCCGHTMSGGIACVLEASRAGACDRQLQQQRNRRDAADRRGYPLQQATRDCPATAIAPLGLISAYRVEWQPSRFDSARRRLRRLSVPSAAAAAQHVSHPIHKADMPCRLVSTQ